MENRASVSIFLFAGLVPPGIPSNSSIAFISAAEYPAKEFPVSQSNQPFRELYSIWCVEYIGTV